jgi:hypothetical protein
VKITDFAFPQKLSRKFSLRNFRENAKSNIFVSTLGKRWNEEERVGRGIAAAAHSSIVPLVIRQVGPAATSCGHAYITTLSTGYQGPT